MNAETKQIVELTAQLAAKKAVEPLAEDITSLKVDVAEIKTSLSVIPTRDETKIEIKKVVGKCRSKGEKRRRWLIGLCISIPPFTAGIIAIAKLVM